MSQQIINYGAAANDGTGDPLRVAFIKTDDNFDQIWAAGPVGSNITILNNIVSVTNTNGNLVLMPNGVGVVQVRNSVIPAFNNSHDLGSANSRFRSAYIGTGGLSVNGNLSVSGDLLTANIIFTQPVTFPSDVTIEGNLTVNGDTVTVNVSNLAIEDKTIILANGSPNAAAANGAGIEIAGANASFTYSVFSNAWVSNIGLDVNGLETTDGLAVKTNGFSWFMGGNILTTPNGGSWYSDTVNNDEYISSAYDGYISISSLYSTGNIGSELDLLHGLAQINVHDFDNTSYTWRFGESSPTGVTPDLFTPGNILPNVSNSYSLGNATNQWSDLWVSNATIYMNSVPVSLTAGNVLTVGGQPLLSNDSNTSISTTGTITADEFFGNISAANVVGLATVATSGSYNDLADTPVIPTATSNLTNDSGFITSATANVISVNGQSGTVVLSIPTATSNLTNDSGFITSAAIPANVSAFNNDAGYITAATANVISVNGQSGTVILSIPTATSNLNNDSGFITVDNLSTLTSNVTTTGNISGAYILGNGSQLTGLPASYTDSNVVTLLSAFGSNTISTTGNVTANYFIGNGSQLTGLPASYSNANVATFLAAYGSNNISTTGNITAGNFIGNIQLTGNVQGTSSNVDLVAGSYTWTFDNTGIVTLPAVGSNEGGEINFGIPTANTTLIDRVKVDVYQDRVRFFDGSTKGAYIDLSQAAAGVGTLLNNRVSGLVNAGTFVTMDNIKATVTSSAPHGLSLATVSGSFSYNIGGTFGGATVGFGGSSLGGQTLTTTPTTSIFGWGFTISGDIATYTLTDTTNNRCYRITVQIGASFNNNSIVIERLI